MRNIKIFEEFINENLFHDRTVETYLWLRYMGNPKEKVVPFILQKFDIDADELSVITERWLDDYDMDPDDVESFVKNPPKWFKDFKFDKDKKYTEIQEFLKNK